MFNKICVLGCGLIGSSLLRAIEKKNLSKEISAFDKSKDVSIYLSKNFFFSVAKNIEEAVLIVLSEMSSEQTEHLRQIHKEDLTYEHFGFSLWVRNLLGDWVPPVGNGEYSAHPDDISGVITEMIWRRLQNED